MNRASAVAQLKDVYRVLSADLDAAVAYGKANPSAFAHRTLVRSFFALVEGLTFQLRQVTLATLESVPGQLSIAEAALLREVRYRLNSSGEPEESDEFQKMLPTLLFTVRTYVRNHGAQFTPDLSNHGWGALKKAVALRNRITHPKSLADLEIGEQDQKDMVEASIWWKATVLAMLDACDKADAQFGQAQRP